jgi:hypothetical protein
MRRHSILIGVGDYKAEGGLTPLKCSARDVALVAEIAGDPKFMGPDPHCVQVVNPDHETALRELGKFLKSVPKDDVLIFYFSGHGLRDSNGDLFLCFTNTDQQDLDFTALNVRRLKDNLDSKFLRRVLVVLDCCHSGAVGALTKDSLQSRLDEVERADPDGTGIYYLTSAASTQVALEGTENSIFTRHFVNGIKDGSADIDGKGEITVHDLAQYLPKKVAEEAPRQTPQVSAKAASGTFVVAWNDVAKQAKRREKDDERRRAAFESARLRMLEASKVNDVDDEFLREVLAWIGENVECPVDAPTFVMLEEFGARRLGLAKFATGWRSSTVAPAGSEATPTKPFKTVAVEVPIEIGNQPLEPVKLVGQTTNSGTPPDGPETPGPRFPILIYGTMVLAIISILIALALLTMYFDLARSYGIYDGDVREPEAIPLTLFLCTIPWLCAIGIAASNDALPRHFLFSAAFALALALLFDPELFVGFSKEAGDYAIYSFAQSAIYSQVPLAFAIVGVMAPSIRSRFAGRSRSTS